MPASLSRRSEERRLRPMPVRHPSGEQGIQLLFEFGARSPIALFRPRGVAGVIFGFHLDFGGVRVPQADEVGEQPPARTGEFAFFPRRQRVERLDQVGQSRPRTTRSARSVWFRSFPRQRQTSAETGSSFTVSPAPPGEPPAEISGDHFGQWVRVGPEAVDPQAATPTTKSRSAGARIDFPRRTTICSDYELARPPSHDR